MFNNMLFPDNALPRQLTQKKLFNTYPKIAGESVHSSATQAPENASDSLLTRQQLLEVSQNISRYYTPGILTSHHTLVLLAIDPENFYVYWNLADYHQYSNGHHEHDDLKLRVFLQNEGHQNSQKAKLVYESTVSTTQSRQKIDLQTIEEGVVYTASLGKSSPDNRFIALVKSNEIYSLYGTKNKSHTKDTYTKKDLTKESNNIENIDSLSNGNKPKSINAIFSSSNLSGQGHKK